ncbi:Gldg family protein [Sanguibacteroides justesenii]|uniref:ABC transporter n=1 Tax=Sanguibacteroides justesenii TaxID=1547597 RepID=A0A0C3MHM2_9PORP|nr:Gldg family protein [Sanguibacteroides justesenii]KIO46093.1 ABC transporter [Sanguibacteroides justesenii]KIO47469.1 ABC transporter [Sanguibacteroides justesenii]PXZ42884.1 ABC transporter [Sanguibacteroides justesenii]
MNTIYRLAKSELGQLFFSPVAWLVLIIFAFQTGMIFSDVFGNQLQNQSLGHSLYGVTHQVYVGYVGIFTKMVRNLYLYIPLLTMGLMSREFSSGSIKLLYASPITNLQIILGKYLSMMAYGFILICIWLLYILFGACTIDHMDIPLTLSSVFGLYLLICAYSAIGLFMSTLTSYQVVAAMGTLAVLGFLNFVGEMGQGVDFIRDITYWLSISGRVYEFLEGMICSEDVIYFVVVIFLFLALSVIKLQAERKKRSLPKTIFQYSAVIISALFIGYLSTLPHAKYYYDVTATKNNTLTPNSQEIVKKIEGGLTITTYVNLLEENRYTGLPRNRKDDFKRFEKYIRFKPEIKMKYVYYYDHAKDESLESRYPGLSDKEKAEKLCKVDKLNFNMFLSPEEIKKIIDLSPEENRFVRLIERDNGQKAVLRVYDDMEKHPSETEITAALKRFLVKSPRLAFLIGHEERNITSGGDRYYKRFATDVYFRHSLINQGFDVTTLSLKEEEVPQDIDILIIADMKTPLDPLEQERLKRYIDKGGNLFILGEPQRQEFMNPILANFGVQLMPGILVQDNKEDFSPTLIIGEITDEAAERFPSFRLTRYHGYSFAFPSACGLNYVTNKGFDVCPVARSPQQKSWNELETTNFQDAVLTVNTQAGEVEQANSVVLALSRKLHNKEQRIMIVGDADCISNGELGKRRNGIYIANHQFVTGTFKWLSYDEYPIATDRPNLPDKKIKLSIQASIWIKTATMGVIPGCLFLLSIMTWIRRKRK